MASGWDGSGNVNNSDGVRSGRTVCVQERTAPVDATAENFDAMFGTMCDSIENCLALDGQNSPSANLPMNDKKFTGLGAGSTLTDSVNASQVVSSSLLWGGTSTGSSNTQAISVPIAPSAYAAGQLFIFKAGYANSGAMTLNVNSLGAKSVVSEKGVALVAGDIVLNSIYTVIYNGTSFVLNNLNNIICSTVTNPDSSLALTGLGGLVHYGVRFFVNVSGTAYECLRVNCSGSGAGVLVFDSTNYPSSASAGADTGKYLKVNVDGSVKKIKLYADS